MSYAIECRNLCHSYGRKEVLRNLNFTVEPGRIFGLLGKNGVGKSTTINILMGFLQPTSGECRILGEPSHAIRPATRRRIGLLHEGHLQYGYMSIEEVEKFYSAFYPKWKRELYYDLMDRLGLPYTHRIFRMSCGQRSQVTLGLILAQDADLMILDDYSLGLDANYRRLFIDFLKDYVDRREKTILVTSHIVQDLERFVDDIIILDRCGVICQSTLKGFMDKVKCFRFRGADAAAMLRREGAIVHFDVVGERADIFTFEDRDAVMASLSALGLEDLKPQEVPMSLEDAFIGVTGKY
ncbi:ABC transporter ATP-binding protein [Desulfobotulus sp. H1]|uniref:ABC transporter ATP-binding protein n=1 Tax=Desulfobotulus pelophilus TaxID=2823377 RepID=A0ABT3N8J9_9BACT|nr:ABC transporter ATP-binding protein [Desulfobotulus pelophilus]MCW7753786.1 ABC transporter ATP-binding protein [Desulfobotulus pelophilus]